MRFVLYAFAFCLSLYCIFHPLTSSATDPSFSTHERVNQLIQEYDYHDLSSKTLHHVCGILHLLQERAVRGEKVEVRVKGVLGTFYTIPTYESVLYCPPLKPKYRIGRGCHKKVYRALYITKNGIEMVAACIGDKTVLREAEVLKALSFPPEVNPYRCSFSLPDEKNVLVLRYFNMGSYSSLKKRGVKLIESQKLSIARDLVRSLMSMHEKGYAHRDLHNANILLCCSKNGHISAGLIDFGRTLHMFAKSKKLPQGAASRNPPEVLFIAPEKVNKKASDIYALGCVLFSLFFEKEYEGSCMFNARDLVRMTEQDKAQAYARVKEKYAQEYAYFQESRRLQKTQDEDVKASIFQMIHTDPEKRISLKEVDFLLERALVQS